MDVFTYSNCSIERSIGRTDVQTAQYNVLLIIISGLGMFSTVNISFYLYAYLFVLILYECVNGPRGVKFPRKEHLKLTFAN